MFYLKQIYIFLFAISFSAHADDSFECGMKGPLNCGYPAYEQSSNSTIFQAGDAFTTKDGNLQPGRVGAKDFFLVGKFKYINKYLKSKETAIVIAQSYINEGKWVDATKRHVFVVLTNKMIAPPTLIMDHIRSRIFEVVHSESLSLDKISYISGALDTKLILQNKENQVANNTDDDTKSKNLVATIQNMGAVEKVNYLNSYFQKIVDQKISSGDNISKRGEVIVTLTAYPPPQTSSRLVCDIGNAKVTFRQVRKTVDSMLNKRGCVKFENFP
ncbi:hypothetical protein QEJ31_04825 [Pigmentibacter sp. JX0631]|uniref:hypothetical protein n=1 Tax=Pigmentibacter sp. JX0631 TaxID=2976982 RepID=UPI0024698327|nr:hypothetical protein [Pigmentibacter sp. JX0631]WGL60920.1 hypothetical protein QEJ31_04825 [Pigmentibacter sp. JX0631]